jgi:energy-coupling factor transporter ATP-binding protein EcfA2
MKSVDIRKLYKDLTDFFDIGFRFKHQRVVPPLLASLIMLFPIMDAFERPPLLFVTGDTNSGKSTLLNVFGNVGIHNNTGLRLLFGSAKYDNYSSASAAYEATCSTLLRIYDEFEISHRNPRHAEAVRAIYELYRTLVNGLTNRIRKNAEGGVDRIVLRHPIIFGAISGADIPQDINRLTIIEMKQQKGNFFPLQLLQDQLGQEKINQLSRVSNLALFHHVPGILACMPTILREYNAFAPSLPIPIDGRYVTAFFSTFALMQYLGVDWKKFFYDWVTANEDTIVRSSTVRESDTVLRDMLYAYVIKQSERDNLVCVAQLLSTPDTRENINTASVGMYYDRQQKLLLINIQQALPRVLNQKGQIPMTSTRLKDILDRHASALTTREILQSGIISKAERFLGTGMQVQGIVVLRADEWLGTATVTPMTDTQKSQAQAAPEPEKKEAENNATSANPSDYEFTAKD